MHSNMRVIGYSLYIGFKIIERPRAKLDNVAWVLEPSTLLGLVNNMQRNDVFWHSLENNVGAQKVKSGPSLSLRSDTPACN